MTSRPQSAHSQAGGDGSTIARVALRNTVWVTLGSYLNQVIGFAAMLALTRILQPDIFGFFSLATFWAGLLSMRNTIGLRYAAVREPRTDGALLGSYFVVDLAAALSSTALAVIAALIFTLTGLYRAEVAIGLLALSLADNAPVIVSPISMALEKELQLSRMSLVNLLAYIAGYSLAILLALSNSGIWSLLAMNIVAAMMAILGVYWVCRRRLPELLKMKWTFDRDIARRLLKTGVTTGLALAALSFVSQYDNWLIGTFVDATTLGYYDRAYRIASWPNILLTIVVSRVGYLTMAKVKDDLPRLAHTVRLSVWVLLTLGAPMALGLAFAAPDIVDFLYTSRYASSAPFLRFLAFSNFLWGFISVAFWLATAVGRRRVNAVLVVAQAGALVALATPLTLQFGVGGVMIGVGLAMLIGLALSCVYIARQVKVRVARMFVAPLASMAVAATGLALMSNLPGWSGLPSLARIAMMGAATAGLFGICLFGLQRREMTEHLTYLARVWRRQN